MNLTNGVCGQVTFEDNVDISEKKRDGKVEKNENEERGAVKMEKKDGIN